MSIASTAVLPQVTAWTIDPAHSVAEFKVRHMMISNVKGQFSGIKGSLAFDEADLSKSSIEATIDSATIDSHEPQRDAHLKSADFFDVENFPALTFKSAGITSNGRGDIKVTGDLTIHGVTRSVVFAVEGLSEPAKDPWGNMRIGLAATTKINRRDFGLTWNATLETGGILVGDEVSIALEVQFVKT